MAEIQPIETAKEIGHKALKGSKWVLISTILSKSFQFLTTIILARLLLPADFGVIAISQIIIGIMSLFQDLGMTQALIQKKENIEESADTVFLFNIYWSLILYIAVFVAAPYIGAFFENKEAVIILRILCFSFFLQPFNMVFNAFMKKGFYFRRLFNVTLLPIIFSGPISVILAYFGFGVWALVSGILMGNLLNTILGWLSISWRPTFKFNKNIAKDMLNFGGDISMQNIIIWFENTFDDILVGRWLGTSILGIYRLGFNIAVLPATHIAGSINDIVYSTFVNLQDNRVELKRVFLYIIKYVSLITFPIGVFIASTAAIFIPVFLGNKWNDALPVIQLISLYGTVGSVTFVIPTLCRAVGRPELFMKYLIGLLFIIVPVYVYIVPYGLKAISMVHLIIAIVSLPYILHIGMRLLAIKTMEIMNAVWISIVLSIIIGSFIYVFTIIAPSIMQFSNVINLIIIMASSVFLYILSLYFISRETFLEFLKFIKIAAF
ncbi:MAG: lipopolysaccharide biosynthesis protein [Nitrospirae bacterium]|nr:lipopolysaccharide biosynthesis protein [Nitrospirota bacterium]